MIPIISSVLIATTSHNFDTSELTEINHSQSSLLVAKKNINRPDNESLSNFSTHSKSLTSSITNADENRGNLPVNVENKFDNIISQQKLASEKITINYIPIPVENPPKINANDLGKPLSLTINKPNYQFMIGEKSSLKFNTSKRLIITSRQGNSRQFDFNLNSSSFEIVQDTEKTQENNQVTETNTNPSNVVEILADEQEYLDQQQIIKAKGNVVIRFSNGILIADQVLVNLVDRIAVAEGNVTLERGDQSLRGDRFEYYFVQDRGIIFNAKGEIYQPSIAQDFRGQTANNPLPQQPLSWQFEANQPLRRVVSAEGFSFAVGSIREYSLVGQKGGAATSTGQVNRFRFQAERVDFDGESWNAMNIRITNDPFSPPEFEIRADTAKLRNISPFQDELTTTKSRLVFDQRVSIPLFQDRLIFDRRNRRPGLFSIGFDGEDLGGLYIERDFEIYTDEKTIFTLTPQILLQKAFFPDSFFDDNAINPDDNGGLFNPSSFGLVAKLVTDFSDRRNLNAIINFTGLDLDNIDNRLRATIQLNQKVGDLNAPHNFSLQYNYRDRLFNGSLGFQTVQQSYGLVVTSPYNRIGESGFGFVYQGSVQNVTADTDRQELLGENPRDNLTNLTRFQGAGIVNGNILLWKGQPLPATPEEGLKYTSTPVAPYLSFNTGLTGVASYYSNGDAQPNLTATIGLEGQLGHFSNPFLDYTGFNVSFSQGVTGDLSPFFFDRAADNQVLSLGLTQQLYGPLRAGLQSFINVKTSEEISTDYFIEYSRRTYNIIVRYNPVLEIGSVNLRISDFNWDGNAAPFEGSGIRPVVDGVIRNN
jgi:lipopolysaccharide export system protein LptA